MNRQKSATFANKNPNINTLSIKLIIRLKTIVIILVNTELLYIAYVIQNIVYIKWFFTMDQTTIIILL